VQRGEVWRYEPAVRRPGQSTVRLIVSARAVNDDPVLPVVLGVHILDGDPGGLLAVPIAAHGWASALTLEPMLRSRLVERLDTVDPDTMDDVAAALRAAQDL
jgi:mRNA-degrading endonuclease toxin of MazEF toxin-antitoxin module